MWDAIRPPIVCVSWKPFDSSAAFSPTREVTTGLTGCSVVFTGRRKLTTITARKAKKAIGRAMRRTRMVFCMSGGGDAANSLYAKAIPRVDDGEPRAGRRIRIGLDVKEEID